MPDLKTAAPKTADRTASPARVAIDVISPQVDYGRFPAKRVAGEPCVVESAIYRDGHDHIRAVLRWSRKGAEAAGEVPFASVNPGLDRWRAAFTPPEPGRYVFQVEAWTDVYDSWLADLRKRVDGGQSSVSSEALEGGALLDALAAGAKGEDRRVIAAAADALRKYSSPSQALAAAAAPALLAAAERADSRSGSSLSSEFEVNAERPRARFGAWYELFVRSQAPEPGRSGTFKDAQARLPDIAAMGFQVVYLAPIHPIGVSHRKGRGNTLTAAPGDPGSPWAIGSAHGGHTDIEPALGTLEDFDRFVAEAKKLGLELALDFAIQCSPDHPWVKTHPDWFYQRPDGTIKYAENPPKKYQDIYPMNFDTRDREGLWGEMLRIVLFWAGRGVRIFRVDNPHTKPLPFWHWLIEQAQTKHPDLIFLSEAFTRPPMMAALAKRGFTQSYTYFTWRNTKAELVEYMTELALTDARDYFRPNFFVNTPDILPVYLQTGGPAAFRVRLILAATLSPSYGLYSGFELCENAAIPGTEEYLDSEKFEIRVRDWNRAGNIKPLITAVNKIRSENACLSTIEGLQFLETDNPELIAYARYDAKRTVLLIIVVNLDAHHVQSGNVTVPPELTAGAGAFGVRDLLSGAQYQWGAKNFVRLDPESPAHILRARS